jgi:hypothetical protein
MGVVWSQEGGRAPTRVTDQPTHSPARALRSRPSVLTPLGGTPLRVVEGNSGRFEQLTRNLDGCPVPGSLALAGIWSVHRLTVQGAIWRGAEDHGRRGLFVALIRARHRGSLPTICLGSVPPPISDRGNDLDITCGRWSGKRHLCQLGQSSFVQGQSACMLHC